MQYYGGKQKISKHLCEYLNSLLEEGQPFVDLFCGSCNIVSKIDNNRLRIANDKHKYLISMWSSLKDGWLPPETLSKEEYLDLKENKDREPNLSGFVGFGCSYCGKWFRGYASNSKGYNYCKSARKGALAKISTMLDVEFVNNDYREVDIPEGALVYCDIPYRDTEQYDSKEVGKLNYADFYEWVRLNSSKYKIYISEYKRNVPDDFDIVWELESKTSLRDKEGNVKDTIEVLMTYKG